MERRFRFNLRQVLVTVEETQHAAASDDAPADVETASIVAARLEYLESTGRSAFNEFQLPHAALTLRQGIGRLIRSKSDRGMIAILDKRISGRRYGRVLLRSLPPSPQIHALDEAREYLRSLQHDEVAAPAAGELSRRS